MSTLLKWKKLDNYKPLMVLGVRQCGKTYIIDEPITAADVQVDKNTGIVTVTVIEDFSSVELGNITK